MVAWGVSTVLADPKTDVGGGFITGSVVETLPNIDPGDGVVLDANNGVELIDDPKTDDEAGVVEETALGKLEPNIEGADEETVVVFPKVDVVDDPKIEGLVVVKSAAPKIDEDD